MTRLSPGTTAAPAVTWISTMGSSGGTERVVCVLSRQFIARGCGVQTTYKALFMGSGKIFTA